MLLFRSGTTAAVDALRSRQRVRRVQEHSRYFSAVQQRQNALGTRSDMALLRTTRLELPDLFTDAMTHPQVLLLPDALLDDFFMPMGERPHVNRLSPQTRGQAISEEGEMLPVAERIDRLRRSLLLEAHNLVGGFVEHGLDRVFDAVLKAV